MAGDLCRAALSRAFKVSPCSAAPPARLFGALPLDHSREAVEHRAQAHLEERVEVHPKRIGQAASHLAKYGN
jgi:hypothetical protein